MSMPKAPMQCILTILKVALDYTLQLAIAFADGDAQLQTAVFFLSEACLPLCLRLRSRLVRAKAQRLAMLKSARRPLEMRW